FVHGGDLWRFNTPLSCLQPPQQGKTLKYTVFWDDKMGGKDTSYQIVYRGETLKHFKPGQCVFFQREREYGGGYWLGKTHVDGFECLQRLTSLVITESKMS
ncbi:hypothetical protein POX10_23570, partial [Klebsiella pneumoniae]